MIFIGVSNWSKHYEKAQTRSVQDARWVPMPINLSGAGYVEIVTEHENGPAHFGIWCALLQVAARGDPRGLLMRAGNRPHTEESLASLIRFPLELVREAIDRLFTIRWLERVEYGCSREVQTTAIVTPPTTAAVTPRPLELQDSTVQNRTTDVGAEVSSASSPPSADSEPSPSLKRFPRWFAETPSPGGIKARAAQAQFVERWESGVKVLEGAFPDVDVLAEAAKLYAYEEANSKKRKAPSGRMPALQRWIQRSVNQGNAVQLRGPRSPPDPKLPEGAVPLEARKPVTVPGTDGKLSARVEMGPFGGYCLNRREIFEWDDEMHSRATCIWKPIGAKHAG